MKYPEGATPLDPDEMDGLRHKHVTTREELNYLEQANIQKGLQWMKRSRQSDIIQESYVRELHRQLFGEVWSWAGTFRTTEKNIGVDPRKISVQLRNLLDDVRYWIEHKAYAPEEIAIRFHHGLVAIHPFPNGNGRHARVMADALMLKIFKKPPIRWTGGKNVQEMGKRRSEYILGLQMADQGDYDSLLEFGGVKTEGSQN